jgi:adenylate cyclase
MPVMAPRALTWLYRKLGRHYPVAFLTVELQTAFIITAATLGLFSFYFEGTTGEYVGILIVALGLTAVAVLLNLIRTLPLLRPVLAWIRGTRTPEGAAKAWASAVSLPYDMIRRDVWLPVFVVVTPSCVVATIILHASWPTFFPLFAGSLIAVGYGAILHTLALEAGMKPVLVDINQYVTPDLSRDVRTIPLRIRLMGALPLINLITGITVAALTTESGGGANLGLDVLVALIVSTTISLELTVMLSKSILRPIDELQRATEAIRHGDYDIELPVTSADELGHLASTYNEMVAGLRERERLREAFGTYLDKEVAEYILSEGFTERGQAVEVSILVCDVRDFTSFAAHSDAHEVVGRLNELFEIVVPIVARHGGHVDKFVGDGLLAVFGAPEPFPDHADRAVRAACQMSSVVNSGDGGPGGLKIGVGVNTGEVVAGSIGGAGRLNFSVIGDAVNVAARVEAATREIDEDVLITEATMREVSNAIEARECGPVELKGIDQPMKLHAPRMAETAAAGPPADEEPLPVPTGDGDGDGRLGAGRESRGLAQL